jgi:predicted dehydrogenase
MNKLRGAVIGCGMIAEFHLRGWQRIPEVEIVALTDPVRKKAEERGAQFAPQARVHDDMDTLLAHEQLDFVDILSPPAAHAGQCLRARSAGLHVICQKPLCERLEEARSLIAAFIGHPRLFCVHENHVYRPWFSRIVNLHRAGYFGAPFLLRLVENDPATPPQKLNLEAERGVLLQYGVHLVDMTRRLLGVPQQVSARLHRVNPEVRGESLAHVLFGYAGATAMIDAAWKPGGVREAGAFFLGERGEARFDGTMIRGEEARLRIASGARVLVDETRSTNDDYVASFHAFQREFADAVLHSGPAPQPAADNLHTLEMTFAAYAAAERGTTIAYADFVRESSAGR